MNRKMFLIVLTLITTAVIGGNLLVSAQNTSTPTMTTRQIPIERGSGAIYDLLTISVDGKTCYVLNAVVQGEFNHVGMSCVD